jgi:hypothetical protein
VPHKDPEIRRAYMKNWKAENPEKLKVYARRNYEKTKERKLIARRVRYRNDRERTRKQSKQWLKENRERYLEWRNEYLKRPDVVARKRARFLQRKKSDPYFALIVILRSRIRCAVLNQAGVKAAKSIALLGCTISKARKHIEAKFQPGMTWENFGRGGWHIDHIIPCSAFDLRDVEHQRRCFHYTNLRPLWERDNLLKGATIPDELPLKYRLPTIDTGTSA